MIVFIRKKAGSALAAAPSIIDSILTAITGSAVDPLTFATAGLDWSAGQTIISVYGVSNDITITDPTGDTDDTSTPLEGAHGSNVANLYEHRINVNGGALDANMSYDMSANRRCVAFLITCSGVSSITAGTRAEGVSVGAPVSPSVAVTGGPKNLLVITTANSIGGHDTNPPQAPSGFTLGAQAPAGATESATTMNTAAWAWRTYTTGELAWSGGNVTVPAATWTGWTNIADQPWQAGQLVLVPA